MTTTFLKWLRDELDKISYTEIEQVPLGSAREGETVIGTVEDLDTKRLYVLLVRLRERSRKLSASAAAEGLKKALDIFNGIDTLGRSEEDSADCAGDSAHGASLIEVEAGMREAELAQERADLVNNLFWADVKQSLSEEALMAKEPAGNSIGVREDWSVVCFDEKPRVVHVLMGGLPPFPFGATAGE